MDIGLLKAFLEVYRSRHFGRAAKNLFISQSAVSARIKQLEEELGTPLFTRHRNNIDLTTEGKKFLGYAENILNTWNRARQEIALPVGSDTLLNIAALPSIWDIFLEDWFGWLYQSQIATALQADVMQSDMLLRNLLDGAVDLGFVFDPPKTPRFLLKELVPIPLILVSSKPNLGVHEAVNNNYIFVDWGTSFGMIHARLYPDMPPPLLRSQVGKIALNFMSKCGGSAYLPQAMVDELLGTGLFKVESAPVIEKEAYAVYSKDSDKSDVIEQALRWFDPV